MANVYRVVTSAKDHRGTLINDPGPWLASENEADFWADFLQSLGYNAKVEKLTGNLSGHSAY